MNRSVLSPSSIIRVPSSTLIILSLLGLIHKIFLELRFYFVYEENFFNRIQSPSNCNSFSLTSILHRLVVFHVEEIANCKTFPSPFHQMDKRTLFG